jgi:hypothetical protein
VRAVLRTVVCVIALVQAVPVAAQTEAQLRKAFEGKFVVVRMDMPATHKGVDLHTDRDPAVDFSSYSSRIREFGIALREGARVMVTGVRVKKKNVEFQLAGGGYGTFSDDSGSVYVPTVSKSRREKDLEKEIKDERDGDRRRRLQRELDMLRRDRERENRDREAEKRDLEARKQDEIAQKRLDAGSRVNVWLEDDRLSAVPSPVELRRLLAPVIDFGDDGDRPEVRRKPGA